MRSDGVDRQKTPPKSAAFISCKIKYFARPFVSKEKAKKEIILSLAFLKNSGIQSLLKIQVDKPDSKTDILNKFNNS